MMVDTATSELGSLWGTGTLFVEVPSGDQVSLSKTLNSPTASDAFATSVRMCVTVLAACIAAVCDCECK